MNYDAVAFWSQIAGFILFVVALVWAWSKWLMPAVAAAQETGNERIALAERHRDEMRAALESLRHEIDGARRDGEAMVARVKERARHEHGAIVAEAKDAGERSVRNAEGELARARAVARERLREQFAAKALQVAQQRAAERVDAATNARLVQEFLGSIDEGRAPEQVQRG
jgi:F0F1-type ATP synthase membrane subunit b/b'